MDIPVRIEQVAGNGYVARVGSPFDVSAEGASPEEAVGNLRHATAALLAGGVRVAALHVPTPPAVHPLAKWAGTWKDDPMADEFDRAVAEYRQQVDDDPNAR